MRVFRLLAVAATAALLLSSPNAASAAPINWTTWSNTVTGTMNAPGSVTVTFAGNPFGMAPGYPSWGPSGTFNGGTVGNAPPSSGGIIQLQGGNTLLQTITFSTAITNPVMAIWSLGQGGAPTTFVFSQTPTFQSGGPSNEYGGQAITVSGNTVTGVEGNGTFQFTGTFSSISWTNPDYEFWYGFTVGAPNQSRTEVPEPASILLLGVSLCSFALVRRKTKS